MSNPFWKKVMELRAQRVSSGYSRRDVFRQGGLLAVAQALSGGAGQTEAAPLDIGALGRNTGEVIGVFGHIQTQAKDGTRAKTGPFGGFESSVKVEQLRRIAGLLETLRPPKWPAQVFGTPGQDPAYPARTVARGQELYGTWCKDCHTPLSRTDLRWS